ncbi:MAG: 3-methyl-2-oxobutanoate hydroxymethyltransferase [Candidatus Aminicenantes bacterium]|nr:MAG: 3-methyl-2-oxobutanoate hydroxymethyltransferase [Candidatus Aminicenantes bacterium]
MHLLENKRTVVNLKKKKKIREKISAVTAYDFPTAKVASDAGIDLILVGDSLGMVLQGHTNTLKTTLEEMIYHTRLVASAQPVSLVVTDMPFGSYHISREQAVESSIRCVKEGGAEAVKLEGGKNRVKAIEAIINAEIPVLGHLGLTPQSIHKLGGFKTQGKQKTAADEILNDAIELEKLGVFAIVLESIPVELARRITEGLTIPTIGIGAGKYCDGQILVFHDLVGFTNLYLPKFVRKYADVYTTIHEALKSYIKDIQQGVFPGEKESYHLKKNLTTPNSGK